MNVINLLMRDATIVLQHIVVLCSCCFDELFYYWLFQENPSAFITSSQLPLRQERHLIWSWNWNWNWELEGVPISPSTHHQEYPSISLHGV
jgi:hypothetical protein